MATLEGAKAKLRAKGPQMASNYNASKGRAVSHYGQGIARFLGRPASGAILSSYQAGMSRAEFRAPDPDLWASRYIDKMTGG